MGSTSDCFVGPGGWVVGSCPSFEPYACSDLFSCGMPCLLQSCLQQSRRFGRGLGHEAHDWHCLDAQGVLLLTRVNSALGALTRFLQPFDCRVCYLR